MFSEAKQWIEQQALSLVIWVVRKAGRVVINPERIKWYETPREKERVRAEVIRIDFPDRISGRFQEIREQLVLEINVALDRLDGPKKFQGWISRRDLLFVFRLW